MCGYPGTALPPDESTNGCSYRYYTAGHRTAPVVEVYTFNTAFLAPSKDEEEERAKQRHAAEMRKRDLGYLYREQHNLECKRFVVRAPAHRFQPRWSTRRWRSRT